MLAELIHIRATLCGWEWEAPIGRHGSGIALSVWAADRLAARIGTDHKFITSSYLGTLKTLKMSTIFKIQIKLF